MQIRSSRKRIKWVTSFKQRRWFPSHHPYGTVGKCMEEKRQKRTTQESIPYRRDKKSIIKKNQYISKGWENQLTLNNRFTLLVNFFLFNFYNFFRKIIQITYASREIFFAFFLNFYLSRLFFCFESSWVRVNMEMNFFHRVILGSEENRWKMTVRWYIAVLWESKWVNDD